MKARINPRRTRMEGRINCDPEGLPFDGENYRTTKTALCIEPKWALAYQKYPLVRLGGLEPPTN